MSENRYKFIIVQGRALPQIRNQIQCFPENWKDEFPIINKLGFKGIEWIYDKNSEFNNPILTKQGRNDIENFSKTFNIDLENIVFDWFLEYPLFEDNSIKKERKYKLQELIQFASEANFKRIIFPILEKNSIESELKFSRFREFVKQDIIKILEKFNIEMHLETSLHPKKELELMKELDNEKIKICFDMGNSVSNGFDPKIAIKSITKYLGSVHIKDRKINSGSVQLGKGDVDFYQVFKVLSEENFSGPITFQIFRDKKVDSISVLKKGLTFINTVISKVNNVKS